MNQKEKFCNFVEKFCKYNQFGNFNNKIVLDFGSGSGKLTRTLRDKGINTYGVDFYDSPEDIPNNCVNIIENTKEKISYQIPFDDEFFDISISNNVFEHVMDYDKTLSELSRVTKKNGISIHFFPSRYKPIEPHVKIPGATVFQNIRYIKFWLWYSRKVKFKGMHYDNMTNSELAIFHQKFLKQECNYLTGKEILIHCRKNFTKAFFIDKELFEFWPGRLNKIYRFGKAFPLIFKLHSVFRMKVLFLQK